MKPRALLPDRGEVSGQMRINWTTKYLMMACGASMGMGEWVGGWVGGWVGRWLGATQARARVSRNMKIDTHARARARARAHTRTRARARTHTLGLFLLFLSAVFATFKFEFACGEDGEDCDVLVQKFNSFTI